MSQLLNQLPLHAPALRNSDFRNPKGVSMKLGNLLAVDPGYTGLGLSRGSKVDREVWEEFAGRIYVLHQAAASIERSTARIAERGVPYVFSADDEEFAEGRLLTDIHVRKERNQRVVALKKKSVLAATGALACEACGFDFAECYGQLGKDFAECHHRVPVSQITEDHRTKPSDLSVLCANCHRMIHRSRPMLTVEALRTVLEDRRGKRTME